MSSGQGLAFSLYIVFEESPLSLRKAFFVLEITYLFFMMIAISEPKAIIRDKAS
jgi:hypothetical protein